MPEIRPENKELFYTIDVLDEAISKGKKVSFIYNSYGTDKKLHPKREREYVINPYQMVATNGRYYLICNYDKYDTLSNYRIDRITGITKQDEDTCMVEVEVNEEAFFHWAMQYGLHIEVLEPTSMRERIMSAIKELNDKYVTH